MKYTLHKMSYSYSCQMCGKEIESDKELKLVPYLLPLCSELCKYRTIQNIIRSYPSSLLNDLYILYNLEKDSKSYVDSYKIARLTTKYMDLVIPNLKLEVTNECD